MFTTNPQITERTIFSLSPKTAEGVIFSNSLQKGSCSLLSTESVMFSNSLQKESQSIPVYRRDFYQSHPVRRLLRGSYSLSVQTTEGLYSLLVNKLLKGPCSRPKHRILKGHCSLPILGLLKTSCFLSVHVLYNSQTTEVIMFPISPYTDDVMMLFIYVDGLYCM